MGMIVLGLRNLPRKRVRLVLVAILIGVPFFLLLAMQSIGEAVRLQTAILAENVNTVLQLRARGSMGHVNMVGQDRILPQDVLERVRGIEHVGHVEPYLLAMAPITSPNFVMHVGLAPTAIKRLESHGEAGNPRIIAGRDFTPEDAGQDVAIIGQGYAQWAGIRPEHMGTATLTVDPRRTHPVIFAMDRPTRKLRIVGMYASGYVFGDLQLFMPIETFRSIYGTDRGISWLFVKVDSVENVPLVARRLREIVGDVADIVVPESAAVFTATTSRTVMRLSGAGGLLAIALMVMVVFFVLLMTVRERAREIGTLKAIGERRRRHRSVPHRGRGAKSARGCARPAAVPGRGRDGHGTSLRARHWPLPAEPLQAAVREPRGQQPGFGFDGPSGLPGRCARRRGRQCLRRLAGHPALPTRGHET